VPDLAQHFVTGKVRQLLFPLGRPGRLVRRVGPREGLDGTQLLILEGKMDLEQISDLRRVLGEAPQVLIHLGAVAAFLPEDDLIIDEVEDALVVAP
jgi:hypothetical protein